MPYCYFKYVDLEQVVGSHFGHWLPTCASIWILDLWKDLKCLALALFLPFDTELSKWIENEKIVNTVSSFIVNPSWLMTCVLPGPSIIAQTNWYNLQLKLLLEFCFFSREMCFSLILLFRLRKNVSKEVCYTQNFKLLLFLTILICFPPENHVNCYPSLHPHVHLLILVGVIQTT